MSRPKAIDYIDVKFLNDKVQEKLFSELKTSVQNQIVMNGMKVASKIILDKAKSNFQEKKKNKSKTKYKNFKSSFKAEPMQSEFGLKVGVKNFKYHWLEWGTKERSYKKGVKRSVWKKTLDKSSGHKTGEVSPTHFFYDAVKDKKDEAESNITKSIIDSMNRTVAKYNAINK